MLHWKGLRCVLICAALFGTAQSYVARAQTANKTAAATVRDEAERDGKEVDAANPYWPYVASKLGRLRVDRAGKYALALKPQALRSEKKLGLTLVSVRLVPAGS